MTFSFQPTKFISSFLKTVFVGAVFLLIFVSVCDLTDYIYILMKSGKISRRKTKIATINTVV